MNKEAIRAKALKTAFVVLFCVLVGSVVFGEERQYWSKGEWHTTSTDKIPPNWNITYLDDDPPRVILGVLKADLEIDVTSRPFIVFLDGGELLVLGTPEEGALLFWGITDWVRGVRGKIKAIDKAKEDK